MATGRTPAEFTAALRDRERARRLLVAARLADRRRAPRPRSATTTSPSTPSTASSATRACSNNLLATDTKGSTAVGMVRVEANDLTYIGKALDAGATAVIVPLIDNAQDAADAVAAVRYPPLGRRSYGPMRLQLRVGPNPADTHDADRRSSR